MVKKVIKIVLISILLLLASITIYFFINYGIFPNGAIYKKEKVTCHVCGAKYTIPRSLYSYDEVFFSNRLKSPRSTPTPIVCPICGAPHKSTTEITIGNAKDILLLLLESNEKASEKLYHYSGTQNDLNKWISFLKTYSNLKNFEEWRNNTSSFYHMLENTSEGSKNYDYEIEKKYSEINKLEKMFSSGELTKRLDQIESMTSNKIKTEISKYKF